MCQALKADRKKNRVLQLCEIYRLQLDYVPCLGPTLHTVKLREFDNQVKTESIHSKS